MTTVRIYRSICASKEESPLSVGSETGSYVLAQALHDWQDSVSTELAYSQPAERIFNDVGNDFIPYPEMHDSILMAKFCVLPSQTHDRHSTIVSINKNTLTLSQCTTATVHLASPASCHTLRNTALRPAIPQYC